MSKAPEKPKLNCDYCTPTPKCTGRSGKVWRQGGPSEDFDLCINSCDGGKYTKECSDQCYKKIYGTQTITASKMDIKTTSTYKGSLSDCLALNPAGCYTKDNSGNIEWTAGSSPIRITARPILPSAPIFIISSLSCSLVVFATNLPSIICIFPPN